MKLIYRTNVYINLLKLSEITGVFKYFQEGHAQGSFFSSPFVSMLPVN